MPRRNVDSSQRRAFVFCRGVRIGETGVTLVDIHDTRTASVFPAKFPELTAYVSFETSRSGPVRSKLIVRPPGGELCVLATLPMEADESRLMVSLIDLSGLEFPIPGEYRFALYVDGVLVETSRLGVQPPRGTPLFPAIAN